MKIYRFCNRINTVSSRLFADDVNKAPLRIRVTDRRTGPHTTPLIRTPVQPTERVTKLTNPEIAIMLFALFTLGFLRATLCSLYLRPFYPPKPWYSTENRPQQQKVYAPLLANGVWVLFTSYGLH